VSQQRGVVHTQVLQDQGMRARLPLQVTQLEVSQESSEPNSNGNTHVRRRSPVTAGAGEAAECLPAIPQSVR
jgi:hypothetical protein